jgi:hypothetical protein
MTQSTDKDWKQLKTLRYGNKYLQYLTTSVSPASRVNVSVKGLEPSEVEATDSTSTR